MLASPLSLPPPSEQVNTGAVPVQMCHLVSNSVHVPPLPPPPVLPSPSLPHKPDQPMESKPCSLQCPLTAHDLPVEQRPAQLESSASSLSAQAGESAKVSLPPGIPTELAQRLQTLPIHAQQLALAAAKHTASQFRSCSDSSEAMICGRDTASASSSTCTASQRLPPGGTAQELMAAWGSATDAHDGDENLRRQGLCSLQDVQKGPGQLGEYGNEGCTGRQPLDLEHRFRSGNIASMISPAQSDASTLREEKPPPNRHSCTNMSAKPRNQAQHSPTQMFFF